MTRTTVAVLAVSAVAVLGAVAVVPEYDNGVCQRCGDRIGVHGHYRRHGRPVDCSRKGCDCTQYRPRGPLGAFRDAADTVLGWAIEWTVGAVLWVLWGTRKCATCGNPKESRRLDDCLSCVMTSRAPTVRDVVDR